MSNFRGADFIQAVRDYCAWVEGPSLESEKEVVEAIRLLASLYSGVLQVENAGPGGDIAGWRPTTEDRIVVAERLSHLPFQYYSEIFNPLEIPTEEPVTADLADDLADIYFDIKEGLFLLAAGHPAAATWSWKDSFRTHWGRHASTALRALHCYAEQEGLLIFL